MDYEEMYYQLAAKVADAVELLVSAQQQAERYFLENAERHELIFLGKEQKEEAENRNTGKDEER